MGAEQEEGEEEQKQQIPCENNQNQHPMNQQQQPQQQGNNSPTLSTVRTFTANIASAHIDFDHVNNANCELIPS